MITRNFTLHLNAGCAAPLVINVSQNDREIWVFTLIGSNGVQYRPSSGAIIGLKSDKLGILKNGTVDSDGNVVITNDNGQITAAAGKNVFELLIDDQTHGTANFVVLVEPRPGDQADFSESDLSLLQQAIDGTSAAAIAQGVSDWMDDNLAPSEWVIDSSLSTSGAAADAKKTGDEISALKSALDSKVEVASSDSDTVTLRYKSNGTNVLAPVPSGFAFTSLQADVEDLQEQISDMDVGDGSVTTSKLADHAVTMAKTDFYYSGSLAKSYSWISTFFSTYMRVKVLWTEMTTILNEFPEKLSIVFEGVTDTYWHSGGQNMSMATTSHTKSIARSYKTITVNGVNYGILEFTRTDFETAYNELKTYVDNGESWKDSNFQVTNIATRVPSDATVYFIAGEVTSELIELNFSTTIVSSDFATAVQAVMSGGGSSGSSSYDEELAKARLTGKVMINIGDSYTRNMGTLLDAIATKYGMIRDDQGVNNTKVIDHFQSRADTLVTDYTNGKAISGTTYHASDVAIITFMGGANDGGGISTFVGDGLHVTDTTKLYGACHHIFKVLLNTFTNAKLIVIAQPANYNQSVSNITTDAQAQALGFTNLTELQRMDDYQFSEYVMWNKEKAILDVAKAYSLPSIDMFSNFPTMLNPANRTAYWMDSVHINTAGSKLITDALEKKIVDSGGGEAEGTIQLTITENGTITRNVARYASAEITTNVPNSYEASDEGKVVSNGALASQTSRNVSANGTYDTTVNDEVVVNVPNPSTGTKQITSNGTHDVTDYASAQVNVPNSYGVSDEGKVVSNGALTAQTSRQVTANGTYDTTLNSSVEVAVPASGITPTGTKNITTNGDHDVTQFATAHVDVPTGITPSGSQTFTQNGTYDVTSLAQAVVNVASSGPSHTVIDALTIPAGTVDGVDYKYWNGFIFSLSAEAKKIEVLHKDLATSKTNNIWLRIMGKSNYINNATNTSFGATLISNVEENGYRHKIFSLNRADTEPCVFGQGWGDNTYSKKQAVKYFKVYDANDNLLNEFIPVIKSGIVCFYDTVSGMYYQNRLGVSGESTYMPVFFEGELTA